MVQLYVQDVVGSMVRPVKELKRFEKVLLQPGEKKRIGFVLSDEDLSYWMGKREGFVKEAEYGDFIVFVGGSSTNTLSTAFSFVE